MEFVDGESSTDEAGTENRSVDGDKLPHGWVVVGKDLELGVEVQVQIDEASKGGSGVATRHRLKTVIDLIRVTSANLSCVVELEETLLIVTLAGCT